MLEWQLYGQRFTMELADLTDRLDDAATMLFIAFIVTAAVRVVWPFWPLGRRDPAVVDPTASGRIRQLRLRLIVAFVPAVALLPYASGVAYLIPGLVEWRFPTTREPRTRSCLTLVVVGTSVVVASAVVGAAILAASGAARYGLIAGGYVALGVAGSMAMCWASGLSTNSAVDDLYRRLAVAGGAYTALLGARKVSQTAADAVSRRWEWSGTSVELMRLAGTGLNVVAIGTLVAVLAVGVRTTRRSATAMVPAFSVGTQN